MKFNRGYGKYISAFFEMVLQIPGFHIQIGLPCQKKGFFGQVLGGLLQDRIQKIGDGYFTNGFAAFWSIDDYLRFSSGSALHVLDTLKGFSNENGRRLKINVRPLKRADFADSDAQMKRKQDADISVFVRAAQQIA